MKKTFSKFIIVSILAVTILSPIIPNALAYNSSGALSYLQSHPDNSWSTMAEAVLGSPSISSDYLKSISGSNAIDYEAPILAITALSKDPRNFGSTDYVAKLESFHAAGQIGDATALNDDAFGILALVSAGQPLTDAAIVDAKNFLLAHQNQDGGWGWQTTANSDSNDTAAGVTALIAAGLPAADAHITSAVNYLKTTQSSDGGFLYDSTNTDSDAASTSWVVWALNALSINPTTWTKGSNDPISYLNSYQMSDGSFKWKAGDANGSAGITADAVIALAGKTLPTHIISSSGQTAGQNFDFRIEGSGNTVCTGQALGPSALDIIKNASTQCGFTFDIQTLSFGPYLKQINNDTASGNTGWMYLVNNISPDVGAGDYQLQSGDQVLWYFGDFGWTPTRISLANIKINSGQSTVATVEDFKNGGWAALTGATINIGTQTFTTDSSGHATIANQDGYYKVFASDSGYIRSNQVLLQIGQPNSSTVNLSANVSTGQVAGTSTNSSTIAFTVDQSGLDFGTVAPGSTTTKPIKINNTGSGKLHIESIVSGDSLFINDLSINALPWQNFKIDINSGQSQTESLKLAVPQNYNGSGGAKSGQLVFWASAE